MLDTKRLKLTPSSSERPMSPLAMRRSDESMRGRSSGNSSERRYRVYSDSESEEHELTDGNEALLKYFIVEFCIFDLLLCINC